MVCPFLVTAAANLDLSPGQRLAIAPGPCPELAVSLVAAAGVPSLSAGTDLAPTRDGPTLRVLGTARRPGDGETPAGRLLLTRVVTAGRLPAGESTLATSKSGPAVAWITLSDKGSQGLRIDTAGPAIAAGCAPLGPSLVQGHIIPDDPGTLKALLTALALTDGYDLIVTTGGTGLAPRDTTPEATLAVIEKRLPGFEGAMLAASLAKTPHAMLSRAVAGTLGPALILNLPGSPKAVKENLAAVLPAIPHALDKLHGDPTDCAVTP